jgi:hypothetical protein
MEETLLALSTYGYIGLFIASFLAATVLPFSSEIVFTTLIYSTNANAWVCIAVGTAGNTLGALTCYALGRLGKLAWIERYLRIPASDIEKWNNPEYREKMKVYSEALKLAWEMHPEIKQMMSEVAEEYPGHGKILKKVQNGVQLTQEEQRLFLGYYKRCHERMPGFTWIVGQTQKQIIAMWKEQGIIPSED